MKLPVNFEEFKKSPVTAVAFCLLLGVGYLYYELREQYQTQAESQNDRIEQLEEKINKYENKLDELNQKLLECISMER